MVEDSYNFSEPLEDWTTYTKEDDASHPLHEYQLEDLLPSSFYQIEIRARNAMGTSDPNSDFIFSTTTGMNISLVLMIYTYLEHCHRYVHIFSISAGMYIYLAPLLVCTYL